MGTGVVYRQPFSGGEHHVADPHILIFQNLLNHLFIGQRIRIPDSHVSPYEYCMQPEGQALVQRMHSRQLAWSIR